MTLEQQVVSLELAKKMKELDFKQESIFYWKDYEERNSGKPQIVYGKDNSWYKFYSAYTVAELGEMLPYNRPLTEKGQNNNWWIKPFVKTPHFKAETEADARAKMLIYLKENNLI